MTGHKGLHGVAWILVIIGGLNWLVFGLFGWDIVGAIFGGMMSTVAKIIYILVGLSAVYELFCHKSMCKMCDSGMGQKPGMGNMPMGNMGMK